MPDRWYQLKTTASNVLSRKNSEGLKLRLEVVVALIAILSFFGVDQWRENGDKEGEIAALNKENAELRTVVDQNDGTIEQLRELNSDLTRRNIELERDQPMPPDDLNSPPLRNNTSSLILSSNGDGIDLEVADDPRFGMSPDVGDDQGEMYYLGDGNLYIGSADTARVDTGEVARHATCAVAQGFEPTDYYVDVNFIDDRTCFRLSSGRFATIKVIKSTSEQVELAIRVWELAE
jgi:cell division protein FtsB